MEPAARNYDWLWRICRANFNTKETGAIVVESVPSDVVMACIATVDTIIPTDAGVDQLPLFLMDMADDTLWQLIDGAIVPGADRQMVFDMLHKEITEYHEWLNGAGN